MGLLDKLRRRVRPELIEIEIDVIDQIILKHLIRHQTAPALDLVQEVLMARRTANEQQVRLSLIRLESLRLIARDSAPQLEVDNRGREYAITSDGKRLRKVLQTVPTSRIQTYL
ncbi:MAG TPA: hypothetical protein QGF05_01840 [Dehalococcoidia bacterium]|nr:hypothetical protein [Dehalococcoidia bacterium]